MLLLAALLAADVTVYVLQKAASASTASGAGHFFSGVARAPSLWLALALGPVQLWLWTRILKRSDIGWAYPLTALAYPLTMVAAAAIFGERYGTRVWLGAAVIAAGALVIGPSTSGGSPARVSGREAS